MMDRLDTETHISPRNSPRRSSVRYERTSPSPHRSPSPRGVGCRTGLMLNTDDCGGRNLYMSTPTSDPPLHHRRSIPRTPSSPTAQPATSPISGGGGGGGGSGGGPSSSLKPLGSPMAVQLTSPTYEQAALVAAVHRRNTLPKQQYLSPSDVFNRSRSNSYYNRSPSRRRRSFKDCTSPRSPIRDPEDSWESYSASKVNRKMSLPASEPISPGSQTKFVNVVIVGDSSVGKYTLIRHLVDADSDPHSSVDKSVHVHRLNFPLMDHYVEITFEHHQNVDKIIDISRDNGYMIRNMEILVVMYSVTDRRSFEMSAQYLTMAVFTCRKYNPMLNICLLANKTDLVRVREVGSEEGRSLAERFEVSFMEVSVELEDNFDGFMEWLTNCIKEKLKIGDIRRSVLMTTQVTTTKNGTLSQRAVRFVRKILTRRGSKSKSCDNINMID
ncbi:GTP-binding protein REM 1-like [Brevipalpus obovatus]|uniref:GTP-binding protein REM 1-like n=1 Tax=Brevipalpus obovatus TaxID=246614 RepID=UPI003D9DF055